MHKKTGNIRAMKVIPKKKLKRGFTDDDITQEIHILTTLEHPHIIKLFEFYTFKKNYYLINEFCTDGDLSEKLYEIKIFPEFFVFTFNNLLLTSSSWSILSSIIISVFLADVGI